jgi:arylsulfatase A-like enzyme
MRRRSLQAASILVLLAVSAGSVACGSDQSETGVSAVSAFEKQARPNVVIVMTDDQEVESLEVMPTVKRLARKGMTFKNAFASYPLCCPSRATFQTGQYAHNHGVLDNRPPAGGYPAFDASETAAVWLQRAGYETAHVGKYMNDYTKKDPIPPGWDYWFGMVEPSSRYFKVHVSDQGKFRKYFKHNPRHYSTDVFTRRAVRFVKERDSEQPFLLSVGYVAPHVAKSFQKDGARCSANGPEPAPRHLGAFADRQIPRGPAFNESDVADKPQAIRDQPKLKGQALKEKNTKYQCRLETLLSVDEGVGKLVSALRDAGELENTYFLYTSDNGFVQGEHRIKGGKAMPYETAIRIPMIVRGPGVLSGRETEELISNVDVVPTIMDLAGAEAGIEMDGRSFEPSMRNARIRNGHAVLLESRKEPDVFHGVRTSRYVYVERESGESELYDLREDPNELQSVAESPVYAEARRSLRATLERLRICSGEECKTAPKLTLQAEPVRDESGKSNCSAKRAIVSIGGDDAEFVVASRFGAAGDLGRRRGAEPQSISLSNSKSTEVIGIAELADGRESRLKTTVDRC